ncbi:hypothetical protein DEQ92_10295 [Haloferax sp. Atlit-6N]|uniref:hypothetical protein n=1 Tax=Haloferax sp. Atlit-6N TaxID=2077205 RepID=UPI000E22409E|nr:hypothetical protein [Haloferax sp. Atlit-6N]REA03479.1 hypothetical protein DEQ92_10120 [Haloferax sp. Atlit-6N]REA03507.1 hypothetical protein DEQ92_10295 [Haloferax sp. Atlit-6N]
MTVSDFLAQVRSDFERHPPSKAFETTVGEIVNGVGRRVGGRVNYGVPHWERGDWDILVLLDACRFDLMTEVADETDWIPDVDTHVSPASMSAEFVERMTRPRYRDEMSRTALVTANPFSRDIDSEEWFTVNEVWRHSWDDDHGTILPRSVTDAAIRQSRAGDQDRIIVWFMQPHVPFVDCDWSDGYPDQNDIGKTSVETGVKSPWMQLRDGERSFDEFWSAYRRNLELVLDDVRLLVENVDGTVVVSSDHANAVGEFGVYGHPRNSWVPSLKRVPWVELEASDTGGYTPGEMVSKASPADVTEQLEALGYR